jgi:hypothetical protein
LLTTCETDDDYDDNDIYLLQLSRLVPKWEYKKETAQRRNNTQNNTKNTKIQTTQNRKQKYKTKKIIIIIKHQLSN